jgi:hypothetical protein
MAEKAALQTKEAVDPAHKIAYDFYAQAVNLCQQQDFPFSSIRSWVLPFGYRVDPRGQETAFYHHEEGRWQVAERKLWPVNPHPKLHLIQMVRTWVEVTEVPSGLIGNPLHNKPDYFSIEVASAVLFPKKQTPLPKYPTTDDEYFALLLSQKAPLLRQTKIANFASEIFNLDKKTTIYLGQAENQFSNLRPILPSTSIIVGREDAERSPALFRRHIDKAVNVRMVLANYVYGRPYQQEFLV